MSNASKVVLALAVAASTATIGYVHYKQTDDRAKLHEGVLRDVERQQRRKLENTYNLQKQIDLTKQLREADKETKSEAEKENFSPSRVTATDSIEKSELDEEVAQVEEVSHVKKDSTKSTENVFKRFIVATQGKLNPQDEGNNKLKTSVESEEQLISLPVKDTVKLPEEQQKKDIIELQINEQPLKVVLIRRPAVAKDENDSEDLGGCDRV